jgi:putative colanic acid biosynthesis UDP-glucose lipid carrier transferase
MPKGIMHSNSVLISLMQRVLDVVLIFVMLYCSAVVLGQTVESSHVIIGLVCVVIFHISAEVDGLYLSWRGLSLFKFITKTASHWLLSFLVVSFVAESFFVDSPIPRNLQTLWVGSTLFAIVGYRILLTFGLSTLRKNGFNTRSVVIVGAGDLGQKFAKNIIDNASFGMTFTGYYDDKLSKDKVVAAQTLGNLEKLVTDVKDGSIDRVYIVLPPQAFKRRKWLINQLADSTANVYIVPDVFTYELLHGKSDVVMGIPTISIYDSPLDGSSAILKRLEDIILSTVILILISPVLLGIAFAVKLTSKGPVIFKQKRYGIDGKLIEVWKFRSMTVMENGSKIVQATKNDSRFTPIGQFLRRTSLDELPQFFNVLHGEMSIVGPRPHAIAHNEQYRKIVSGYMLRHKVKPGITGWAQINGWRGETDTLYKMQKRVEFDLEYIRTWSILFDIKIVFLTIFKGFINKNAY